MAERMVYDGYKDAGYEYLIIDDCWSFYYRSQGKLIADPRRFPRGMKFVAHEVHYRGLKLGIYTDIGTQTCAGFPGSFGYYKADAETFAEWGVDYIKVDGCSADPKQMDDLYTELGQAIRSTGRDIVYSCEWPLYQQKAGITPNYKNISKTCNTWRNYDDIGYSWDSIYGAVEYEAANQDILTEVSGPGAWTDPDAIVVGNYGLTIEQQRLQMAFWAVMAAPMIMSNDLRSIDKESKELILNKYIIAVNQDPLGKMGRRLSKINNTDVWTRWVSPKLPDGRMSMAVLVHNANAFGGPMRVVLGISDLGLDSAAGYQVNDLVHDNALVGVFYPHQSIIVTVPPLDIFFFKATVNQA
ncbi:hypothetical protein V5799_002729 [Amblyomma americanum]|uniref:Alpha-galactosidase n=1 Tax=Amblyomma americanum TaxID=6943 RepID=A0AAQ4DAZ8_AMBAM